MTFQILLLLAFLKLFFTEIMIPYLSEFQITHYVCPTLEEEKCSFTTQDILQLWQAISLLS